MTTASDPHRPPDAEARALAADLLRGATACALATLTSGRPSVSRAGCAWVGGALHLLVSDLSDHARALRADPACAALVEGPPGKGDPLTHPRLSLEGRAAEADKAALRAGFLAARPKAALFYDFGDFRLLRLDADRALLNGGFGRAWRLAPGDLP